MRLHRVLVTAAVVYLILGGAFSGFPTDMLQLLGIQLSMPSQGARDPRWVLLVFPRLWGTLLLGTSATVFFLRNVSSPEAQRAVATGLFLFNSLAGLMAGIQQISILVMFGGAGWVLVGVFWLLAVAFGYLLVSTRGLNPRETELLSEGALGELRENWVREVREAAAQQERSRLASDLHDSVKQQLFTINVSTAAVEARFDTDPPGARAALEHARRAAHEAMAEMEAMLQHLQPAPLVTTGLVEALRKQCEAIRYRTGADVVVDVDRLPEEESIPAGTYAALFRIAQEALSNIARHARARSVRVRLRRCEEPGPWALELAIEDDGQGFDASTAKMGMGLSNIRTRTRELEAELQLESAPGKGTRLIVRAPSTRHRGENIVKHLKEATLLGIAGISILGFWRRPLVNETLFLFLLPLAGLAFLLSVKGFLVARRAIRELERRGSFFVNEALHARRHYLQMRAFLFTAAFAWNPWYLLTQGDTMHSGQAFALSLLWFASFALAADAFLQFYGVLRRQRAQLTADEFHRELNELTASQRPALLLACVLGTLGVFLWIPMLMALPILLLLWVATLAARQTSTG